MPQWKMTRLSTWTKETELPEIPASATDKSNNPATRKPRNTVITAATGFLGRAMVAQLLQHLGIERIDRIAVRNAEGRAPDLPPVFSSMRS